MNQPHVFIQVSDYVLGLLPPEERQQVEQHAAVCAQCRSEIGRERRMSRTVRAALSAATQPAPGRLAELMPPAPQRTGWRLNFNWQRQLAPITLVLLLALGSLVLHFSARQQTWNPTSPTFLAATATLSHSPTATETETSRFFQAEPMTTAVAKAAPMSATPVPIPAPIVASR
ncbi:MAG: anti-sigma factor family protein [Anaerolineae bacterium]